MSGLKQGVSWVRLSALAFGFAFLYVPILSLVVYSFNKSRLVTVWGGFSTEWYGKLFANEQILQAAWLSLRIAALNATGATLLGTCAGLALARFRQFRGRTLLVTMTTAPLVMPEVITGLSLLLLFVALEQAIGWPEGRGMFTPDDDPKTNVWYVRDPQAMAAAKKWAVAAPFYIDQEAPVPPGGLPLPGKIEVHLPDNHLGYAITWFGLALGLAGVYVVWLARRLRRRY